MTQIPQQPSVLNSIQLYKLTSIVMIMERHENIFSSPFVN